MKKRFFLPAVLLLLICLPTAAHADAIFSPVMVAAVLVIRALPWLLVAAVVVVTLLLLRRFRKKK